MRRLTPRPMPIQVSMARVSRLCQTKPADEVQHGQHAGAYQRRQGSRIDGALLERHAQPDCVEQATSPRTNRRTPKARCCLRKKKARIKSPVLTLRLPMNFTAIRVPKSVAPSAMSAPLREAHRVEPRQRAQGQRNHPDDQAVAAREQQLAHHEVT